MATPPRGRLPGLARGGIARRLSERARTSPGGASTPPEDGEPSSGGAGEAFAPSAAGSFADGLRAACENFATMLERLGAAAPETIAREVELPLGPDGKSARAVFGYTLRMGLDGVRAEPFGDAVPASRAAPRGAGKSAPAAAPAGARQAAPPRAPITDLFEEGGILRVIAELPGADPASLRCAAQPRLLDIETTGTPAYAKTLALPRPVRPETLTSTLSNGILEVRLALADPPDPAP